MKKFFKNRCVFGFVIVVVIFSIIVGIVNVKNPELSFGENIVNVFVKPVQSFFTWVGNGISDFFDNFADKDDLKNEIEKLKKENADLKASISKIELAKKENEELRGLLNLKEVFPEQELKYARIISREPSNWHNTFTINIGSSDGIAVNQPVVSMENTLIGRISEVGTTWAKVITVFDAEHAVGAVVSRSGEYGIVEGDADAMLSGYCRLSYISKNSDIIIGDTIMTSGLGGLFPEGIIIGKIVDIKADEQGIAQTAFLSPVADIENIRTVCVIQNPTK
ncbi:MAG: rod shape-determining protein MreC [Clostridia bacterium]|nr:rod shape-determining protein MreC [Clostridia bacterium]